MSLLLVRAGTAEGEQTGCRTDKLKNKAYKLFFFCNLSTWIY